MRDDVDSGIQSTQQTAHRTMLRGSALNKAIAERLGWTQIVDARGVLLGRPPCGALNSRGQALVPNWAGNWGDCGPLIGQHSIRVDPLRAGISANNEYVLFQDDMDADSAARHAIAMAFLAKLEGRA